MNRFVKVASAVAFSLAASGVLIGAATLPAIASPTVVIKMNVVPFTGRVVHPAQISFNAIYTYTEDNPFFTITENHVFSERLLQPVRFPLERTTSINRHPGGPTEHFTTKVTKIIASVSGSPETCVVYTHGDPGPWELLLQANGVRNGVIQGWKCVHFTRVK